MYILKYLSRKKNTGPSGITEDGTTTSLSKSSLPTQFTTKLFTLENKSLSANTLLIRKICIVYESRNNKDP